MDKIINALLMCLNDREKLVGSIKYEGLNFGITMTVFPLYYFQKVCMTMVETFFKRIYKLFL